jgi:hypothetical protein
MDGTAPHPNPAVVGRYRAKLYNRRTSHARKRWAKEMRLRNCLECKFGILCLTMETEVTIFVREFIYPGQEPTLPGADVTVREVYGKGSNVTIHRESGISRREAEQLLRQASLSPTVW